VFGAAALGGMKQARADAVLELLLEYGVNHIDTAAMYGDSELRLAPWLRSHRSGFFLATKTVQRTAAGARAELERSLERMGVDRVDLIQMHNLVEPEEQQIALGPGGALEALVEARAQGLARFDFDSVLLPYNPSLMAGPDYAADFESLLVLCRERNVAVQTIKAIARRRWTEGDSQRRFSWYEPIRDEGALGRAVRWVLQRSELFLNSSSDATLLPAVLAAASEPRPEPSDAEMLADARALAIEPLFVRGVSDRI